MITGPIFRVELVAAARRRRYFVLRVVYSAIILFTLWVTYESVAGYGRAGGQNFIADMARAAATFFYSFIWIQVIGILLVAPVLAVGAIATERERRTIEYLFTTDLSNLEIVLGKTVARLLLIGQLVLASLPILFIFRLMGGIPARLLMASFLISASTALLVTSISVCVSVWSAKSRDAAMRVYRVMAALFLGPLILLPLLQLAARGYWWAQTVAAPVEWLTELNPLVVLAISTTSSFALGAGFDFDPVWRMTAWHVGASVALIALSTVAVRRVHLRESGRGTVEKRKRWWRPQGFRRWKPQVGDHAMLWKEAFAPTSKIKLGFVGNVANVLIVLTAMAWIGFVFYYTITNGSGRTKEYFQFTNAYTGVIGSGLLLLMAARASAQITVERERDTWISLVSTPLTGRQIMLGKLAGNLYSSRWGFALLGVAWALGVCLDLSYVLMIPIMAGTILLLSAFVSCVGLLYSLRSSTSLRAMGLTMATVVFVGGGYLACCCPVAMMGGGGPDAGLFALGVAPCLLYLVAAPGIFYVEGLNNSGEHGFFAAYVAGVILYAIVTSMLVAQMSMQFDEAAGRTGPQPDAGPIPRPRLGQG